MRKLQFMVNLFLCSNCDVNNIQYVIHNATDLREGCELVIVVFMCCSTTTSPSLTPNSFNDFLSSTSGRPLKTINSSGPGKPDSTSQNALKFSNSRSSDTSNVKIWSVNVVTVIFILHFIVKLNFSFCTKFIGQFLLVYWTINSLSSVFLETCSQCE